jgi:hypothetical protein
MLSPELVIFFGGGDWGLNSGFWACKAVSLLLEPQKSSVFFENNPSHSYIQLYPETTSQAFLCILTLGAASVLGLLPSNLY